MMRRLLRQFRRPAVTLALLYAAGVGLLAGILEPQPSLQFPIRLTEDRHYELAGLSPDGKMLATRQGWQGLNGRTVDIAEPDVVWLWDLADADKRGGAPVPVAQKSPFRGVGARWVDNQPTWERLFWALLAAPGPDEQFRGLACVGPQWDIVWLSPDGRLLVRVWPELVPTTPERQYRVFGWSGPRGYLRIPVHEQLLAIGEGAKWVTTVEYTEQPKAQTIVRRRSLENGREVRRTVLADTAALAMGQPLDGRWLLAGGESDRVGGAYDAETGERVLDISGKPPTPFFGNEYRLARHGKTLIDMPAWGRGCGPNGGIRFTDLESGRETGYYDPPSWEFNAVSPDEETVAVTTYSDPNGLVSRYPKLAWLFRWLYQSGLLSPPNQSYELELLDAGTGDIHARLPGGSSAQGVCRPHVVFSAGGKRFAFISGDDIVRIWDLPIRKPWARILTFAAIPPATLALLLLTVRGLRRLRSPRPALPGAV